MSECILFVLFGLFPVPDGEDVPWCFNYEHDRWRCVFWILFFRSFFLSRLCVCCWLHFMLDMNFRLRNTLALLTRVAGNHTIAHEICCTRCRFQLLVGKRYFQLPFLQTECLRCFISVRCWTALPLCLSFLSLFYEKKKTDVHFRVLYPFFLW